MLPIVGYLIFVGALVFELVAAPLDQILTTSEQLSKVPWGTTSQIDVSNGRQSPELIGRVRGQGQNLGSDNRLLQLLRKKAENYFKSMSLRNKKLNRHRNLVGATLMCVLEAMHITFRKIG